MATTRSPSRERVGNTARWHARLRWLGRAAVEVIYPPACVLCRVPLDGGGSVSTPPTTKSARSNSTSAADSLQVTGTHETPFCVPFCVTCRDRLVATPAPPRCPRCGSNLSDKESAKVSCASCRPLTLHFSSVLPLGDYLGQLRETVLLMKESSHRVLSRSMASLLWEEHRNDLERFQPDLIAAVPMHWSQRLRRGVNNADEVAEELARRMRVPYGPRLLIRRRNTRPQSELSRMGRFENVRDAFRVSKCYRLNRTRILLVDDILTTGATCSEAARMLKRAGAADVGVTVVAKSIRPGKA